MNSFAEQCKSLREKGHTLSEIVAITGRPKTSVYGYIRDIPLTAQRKEDIKAVASARIREFSIARTGKSTKAYKQFSSWSPDHVLLLAHLIFDGELAKTRISYNNRSDALLSRVERLMLHIYEFEPTRYKNVRTGVSRISYNNVELSKYIKQKADELLRELPRLPDGHKIEFLRAFFDDEGCMDFKPISRKRQIRGYQRNLPILEIVQSLLHDIGIESHIAQPNEVVISGKGNLERFKTVINFSPGVRINGNRSNSVWKDHLEKRQLLQMAIDSFKA